MCTASRATLILLALSLFSAATFADTINVGFISYDLSNAPGSSPGTTVFDITNNSGANSSVDFPILDAIDLQNLSLLVNFGDLSSKIYSLDSGSPLFSTTDVITLAILTGTLAPADNVAVLGVGQVTLSPTFTATITPSTGQSLTAGVPGDFAIIEANTQIPSPVPEPGTWLLVATGLAGIARKMRKVS
jgi:hypothetical protein